MSKRDIFAELIEGFDALVAQYLVKVEGLGPHGHIVAGAVHHQIQASSPGLSQRLVMGGLYRLSIGDVQRQGQAARVLIHKRLQGRICCSIMLKRAFSKSM